MASTSPSPSTSSSENNNNNSMKDTLSSLRTSMNNTTISTSTTNTNTTTNYDDPPIVILVDPYSTGCLIGQEFVKRGHALVALWTAGFSPAMKTHVPTSAGTMTYLAQVDQPHGASVAETAALVHAAIADATAKSTSTLTTTETSPTSTSPTSPTHSRTILACLAGGEAGVDLADTLSEYLGLRTNGISVHIPNRRDKKLQQERIRQTGLRSVRQAGSDQWNDLDVQAFLRQETYPVVLKPVESAGSDGVKLCHSYEQAKDHFHLLMDRQMVNGGECPAVLCQEFLRGKEYVVDSVSMDGVHKTMMVWVYDKRPANGSAFVYFGCVPVLADSAEAQIIIPYMNAVLDALDFRNGPSHGEVMLTSKGPCLIELNGRAHGGDGNWRPLCRALTGGYSQVEVTVDCFCNHQAAFAKLPDRPVSPFKACGQEAILVSYSRGTVLATPGFSVLQQLPSFYCLETAVTVGTEVDYTVDLFTGIGSVILMHADPAVVAKDLAFVRYLEEINGLFVYETKLENLKRPRGESIVLETTAAPALSSSSSATAATKSKSVSNSASSSSSSSSAAAAAQHRRVFSSDGPTLIRHMSNDRPELRGPMMMTKMLTKRMTTVDCSKEVVVVVDPYSTGCCIVQEILKRGYRVMALWTHGFSAAMKTHVPLSVVGKLHYYKELTEAPGATVAATAHMVTQAATTTTTTTGAAGTTTATGPLRVVACIAGGEAGVDLADALSEELGVRTNGTRIPNKRDKKLQQELVSKRGLRSVRQAGGATFAEVEPFLRKESYPVVLKPVESAGSDGVKLCHNFQEAKDHFDVLMNSQMVNGGACPSVLCQEFLRGKEYVVDHVSRDGIHKTVMVWVYDKRPANGAAFVYFGCVPVLADSAEAQILIPYVRRVLDALDVRNGPSHAEVMMTNDGPCLVEMNCRAHGGDGNWRPLCRALTGGYSQVEVTVDAYLDSRQFLLHQPEVPPSPFMAHGQEVILVSFARGVVQATPGFTVIRKELASFVYLETGVREGSYVDYTVDLFTGIGSVILMHHDRAVLEADVARIREMEKTHALFDFVPAGTLFKSTSSVGLAGSAGAGGSSSGGSGGGKGGGSVSHVVTTAADNRHDIAY